MRNRLKNTDNHAVAGGLYGSVLGDHTRKPPSSAEEERSAFTPRICRAIFELGSQQATRKQPRLALHFCVRGHASKNHGLEGVRRRRESGLLVLVQEIVVQDMQRR
jgi:hypothetical protein